MGEVYNDLPCTIEDVVGLIGIQVIRNTNTQMPILQRQESTSECTEGQGCFPLQSVRQGWRRAPLICVRP